MILRQSSLASEASTRRASWSEGISSEKKATFRSNLVAAAVAMLSAKAVFPTEGRAAMMVSVPGCRPRVFLSSEAMPVGTPVMGDSPARTRLCTASRFSTARIIGSWICFSVSIEEPWAAPKTSCWAVSRNCWTLAPAS